jgi:hypothetical protein
MNKTLKTQGQTVENITAFRNREGLDVVNKIFDKANTEDVASEAVHNEIRDLNMCLYNSLTQVSQKNYNLPAGTVLPVKTDAAFSGSKISINWDIVAIKDEGEGQLQLRCSMESISRYDITKNIYNGTFPNGCIFSQVSGQTNAEAMAKSPKWADVYLTKDGATNIMQTLTKIRDDWNNDSKNSNKQICAGAPISTLPTESFDVPATNPLTPELIELSTTETPAITSNAETITYTDDDKNVCRLIYKNGVYVTYIFANSWTEYLNDKSGRGYAPGEIFTLRPELSNEECKTVR